MKKATQKSSTAVSLGTKRLCPKCATKFYDFNKDEPVCPKCEAKIDLEAITAPPKPEPKKLSKAAVKEAGEEAVLASEEVAVDGDDFESVEDLEDEDDDVVEDIDVDAEENESF